jgi:hypothetical protein
MNTIKRNIEDSLNNLQKMVDGCARCKTLLKRLAQDGPQVVDASDMGWEEGRLIILGLISSQWQTRDSFQQHRLEITKQGRRYWEKMNQ